MKYFLVVGILLCFCIQTYARHCPLPTDFSHNPPADWRVSEDFLNQGWILSNDALAKRSALTTMPDRQLLFIQLFPGTTYPNKANCNYHLGQHESGWISVINKKDFAAHTVPVPPFTKYAHTDNGGYFSRTRASKALEYFWGE